MRTKQVGHTQGLSSGAPVRQGLQVYWPEPTGWPERPLKPGITPTRHHAWPPIMPSACWAAPSRCHVLSIRHGLRIREGLCSRLPLRTAAPSTRLPLRTRLLPAHGVPTAPNTPTSRRQCREACAPARLGELEEARADLAALSRSGLGIPGQRQKPPHQRKQFGIDAVTPFKQLAADQGPSGPQRFLQR